MDYTLTEHKRRRGTAKGNLTKVSTQTKTLQAVEYHKLKRANITKQLELLERADEMFLLHHQGVYDLSEGEEEITNEQYEAELEEHRTVVDTVKEALEEML